MLHVQLCGHSCQTLLIAISHVSTSSNLSQVGHSARPLYEVLHRHGVALTAKSFAMGFRVEHPQALIDSMQYGETDAAGELPVAAWGGLQRGHVSCAESDGFPSPYTATFKHMDRSLRSAPVLSLTASVSVSPFFSPLLCSLPSLRCDARQGASAGGGVFIGRPGKSEE